MGSSVLDTGVVHSTTLAGVMFESKDPVRWLRNLASGDEVLVD